MPANYSGNLTVLLNDRSGIIVIRNLLILLILGTEENVDTAVELALHLWYSAFVQATHPMAVMALITQVIQELKKPFFTIKLGDKSTLSGSFEEHKITAGILGHLSSKFDFEQAQKEYQRVL